MSEEKPKKPRKDSRNPNGSMFKNKITKDGKKIDVWDVRKRHPVLDAEGNPKRNEKGKIIYQDKTQRCYSYAEACIALGNLPTVIEADRETKKVELEDQKKFFALCDYFEEKYCKPAVIIHERQVSGYRQRPDSIKKYLKEYKEYFGNIELELISYESLHTFAEFLAISPTQALYGDKTKVASIATVNRKLSYLRRVLNVGVQKQWLRINPFRLGKPLIKSKDETSRERVLTYAEEQKLLAVCDLTEEVLEKERYGKKLVFKMPVDRRLLKIFIIMAIDTGMRKKEILTLKRGQIKFDRNVIELPAPLTKAFKQRVIPISDRLKTELLKFSGLESDGLIFAGAKDFKKAFATAVDRAGIEGLTIHDLRHTATTWLNEAGVSESVRMNIVGHSTSNVHQRYNNLSEDVLNSTRDKMNKLREELEKVA